MDVGVSGGVWGLQVGYRTMVGGLEEAVERLRPILDVLAPPSTEEHGPGWGHFVPSGAGHYVKMVHNGVEYGMMQAYAEGFALFDAREFELDNAKIAHLWMSSVVRPGSASWRRSRSSRRATTCWPARGGLGRGPLDGRGCDRQADPDAGNHHLAVRALLLTRAERVRREGQRGAARPVRRPRRSEDRGRLMASTEQENVLVEAFERFPVHPTTLVIFGATGDLRTASCCRPCTTSRTRARCRSAST